MSEETKAAEELEQDQNQDNQTTENGQEATTSGEAEATAPVDVSAAVEAALVKDRKRQAEIRELGNKFGFTAAAEEFALNGKSLDQFRAHILNKSPEQWETSLKIRNPAAQSTEQELDDYSEGADVVAKIREKRQARFAN